MSGGGGGGIGLLLFGLLLLSAHNLCVFLLFVVEGLGAICGRLLLLSARGLFGALLGALAIDLSLIATCVGGQV